MYVSSVTYDAHITVL